MSTRKLILAAIFCGLAIVLAGGTKLFQVAREDARAEVFPLRTSQTLADMTVSVDAVEQAETGTFVTVSMVGVEDADAGEGWRVLADGVVLSPLPKSSVSKGVPCDTTSVGVLVKCVVAFPVTTGSVTVAYLRAGAQSQWAP
jgi:hypothetical protein